MRLTHEARKRPRTPMLLAALTLAALAAAVIAFVLTRGRETTDDAQVEGHVVVIATRVPGQIARVRVVDHQAVAAGDVLVELDPADFAAKLEAARADAVAAGAALDGARAALAITEKSAPGNLAQAQGGVTSAASSASAARAAVDLAVADVAAAEARRALAQTSFDRTSRLARDGAVPQASLDDDRTALDTARAALDQARARLAMARASVEGSQGSVAFAAGRLTAARTLDEQVAAARAAVAQAEGRALQARAALKQAELDLSYTTIRAPRGGIVSRRTAEAGQMTSPDRPLLAIVPLDDVWIIANFKEDQIGAIRPGQPATVTLDTYGGRHFAAHVVNLGGGTGARFALLPPDNASGNFVKVTQRIPVLLALDARPDVALRPGMSAEVTVRTAP